MGLRAKRGLTQQLQRDVGARLRFYVASSAGQWGLAILAWLAVERSLSALLVPHLAFPAGLRGLLLWPLAILTALALVLPVAVGPVREQARRALDATMGPMVPQRPADRWGFALLAVSAGSCEELTYRGFLLAAIAHVLPSWPAFAVIGAGAVIFGLAHLFQGATGLFATTGLGLLFGLLFVLSGTVAVPIAFHLLLDLRVLLLLRPAASRAEVA